MFRYYVLSEFFTQLNIDPTHINHITSPLRTYEAKLGILLFNTKFFLPSINVL